MQEGLSFQRLRPSLVFEKLAAPAGPDLCHIQSSQRVVGLHELRVTLFQDFHSEMLKMTNIAFHKFTHIRTGGVEKKVALNVSAFPIS